MVLLIRLSLQTLSVSNLLCTDLKSISKLKKAPPDSAKECFYQSYFFKRALKAFTRVLKITVDVTSVLQTHRLILEEQVAYAMKGSTRSLDYMLLLAKVIADPRVLKFCLLFTTNISPFLNGQNPPALSS